MERAFFIQSNNSQRLGALLSKYSIERFLMPSDKIRVEIMQVEEIPAFQRFVGKTYLQGNEERVYRFEDEQSFTLTRFMPPELMRYQGRAVVIDPDVFAVQDPRQIFDTDMQGTPIASCPRAKTEKWDTSVMLLECEKLDWKIEHILAQLAEKKVNYNAAARKLFNLPVTSLSRIWNDLETIGPETRMLHYTRQRTQPWKTGLPFTVTPRKMGKVLGIIPREWLPHGRAKYPLHYQPHPDRKLEQWFLQLVSNALGAGAISEEIVRKEIEQKHIRTDLLSLLPTATSTL